MSKIRSSYLALAVSIIVLIYMPGCMPFADSAAMRIEVEVYKGPLSLEPEIQVSELYGYLMEAQNGLIGIQEMAESIPLDSWRRTDLGKKLIRIVLDDSSALIDKLARSLDLFEPSSTHSRNESSQIGQVSFFKGAQYHKDLNKERSRKPFLIVNKLNVEIIADISRTTAAMQAAAFRYATMSTIGTPFDAEARVAATLFTVAASEYGNQLEARMDALLKQFGPYGRDRRELPLSTHLREAEPTDFVHLFDWADGHIPRLLDYITFDFQPNVYERIKILERLYADHFWSKINTVYASGRGKTQMAFIKDETGNWNLKSFDNDPTELLDSYTMVSKSALKGVVEIAGKIASGGADAGLKKAADELLAIARQTDPDKSIQATPSDGGLSLDHLRARIDGQLNSGQVQTDLNKDKALMDKLKTAKDASDEVKVLLENSKQDSTVNTKTLAEEEKTAGIALEKARNELAAHRKTVIEKWSGLVDDHSQLVDLLSSTMKKK